MGLIRNARLAAAPEVEELQDFAARVQEYRFDIKVSPHPETTRSTALWSAMRLDDQIRTSLEDSKISMAKLASDLSLTTDSFTTQATTTRVHDDFADAMTDYLAQRTISGPVGLAEVVLAILLAARDSTSGLVGKRLGNVDTAIVKMRELAGVPSPPIFDPQEFSGSVLDLRRKFFGDSTVTPGLVATELQRSKAHRDYAGGRFMDATFDSTGPQAPFEEWCRLVRGQYDMELVRRSGEQVIDGRMFLIGLARLDADFAEQLDKDGVLDALRSEVSVPIRTQPPAAQVADLKGGVSREYVDPTKGISLTEDRLGAATYVSMLATVICDPATPTPLSVGVFGEWGSGKSFFMGLLRGQIDAIARREDDLYFHDIRQISFNAWHYADSNLWASLGDEIFRQLLQEDDPHKDRQAKLRHEFGELNTQRKELQAVAEHAEAEAVRLRTQVAQASADRDIRAKDLLAAMEKNPAVKEQLEKVWRRLGIGDPVERSRILAAEVRGTATEAAVIRRSLADRRGLVITASAVVVLLLVVLFALWPTVPFESVVRAVTAATSTFLAAAVAVATATRRGLADLRRTMDEIRTDAEQTSIERTAQRLAEPLKALRDAEAARDLAQTQLTAVVARVTDLGRELSELTPGQRLYSFLAERIEAGDYSRSLGLISTIRKDFERLIALMAEWREAEAKAKEEQQDAAGQQVPDQQGTDDEEQPEGQPEAGEQAGKVDPAKRAIDRIVLYIDDLDRCSPKQVVDVLQAVHLLIALDLFVVVVGVDPRWMVRSLQETYPKLLDPSHNASEDDGWDASPEDYLEKIFGIPLVLPTMAKGTLDGILRGIMAVEQQQAPPLSDGGTPPIRPPQETDKATIFLQEKKSIVDDLTQPARPPLPPRLLSDSEIRLLAALEPLVGTPREAKRLANVYRMVRATRDLSPASRFMGDDGQPGEYEAVVLLLGLLTAHARLLGAVLDSPAEDAGKRPGGLMSRSAKGTWSEFVAGMEPRSTIDRWSNDFVPTMSPSDRLAWQGLREGFRPITDMVTLSDLAALQAWAPHIRRFSFVMSPGQKPSLRSTPN